MHHPGCFIVLLTIIIPFASPWASAGEDIVCGDSHTCGPYPSRGALLWRTLVIRQRGGYDSDDRAEDVARELKDIVGVFRVKSIPEMRAEEGLDLKVKHAGAEIDNAGFAPGVNKEGVSNERVSRKGGNYASPRTTASMGSGGKGRSGLGGGKDADVEGRAAPRGSSAPGSSAPERDGRRGESRGEYWGHQQDLGRGDFEGVVRVAKRGRQFEAGNFPGPKAQRQALESRESGIRRDDTDWERLPTPPASDSQHEEEDTPSPIVTDDIKGLRARGKPVEKVVEKDEEEQPPPQSAVRRAWPNRYGIMPGPRWDGVDRSNGREKEVIRFKARKREEEETANDAYAMGNINKGGMDHYGETHDLAMGSVLWDRKPLSVAERLKAVQARDDDGLDEEEADENDFVSYGRDMFGDRKFAEMRRWERGGPGGRGGRRRR